MSGRNQINKDLMKERQGCNFDVNELIHLLDGGSENTAQRVELERYVLNTKGLKDDKPELYMDLKERYDSTMRKACLVIDALRKHPLGISVLTSISPLTPTNCYHLLLLVTKDVTPFLTHFGMFLPTIASQSTPEQLSEWMPKTIQAKILGAYAQTELGHGSSIKDLETTATYDFSTEEFVLHSPTLTSHKWWPGGLANTANHAVVVAQLIIKDKCYGPHGFLVQIRDSQTHMPLPGVKIGEIGPKIAFKTTDNGFLALNKHRIPRKNMFMKNAVVEKDGTYKTLRNEKLAYVPMMEVRVSVVYEIGYDVTRAVTIATRYSAVRRQSRIRSGEPEVQVMDYVTQQHRLFIALSTGYAFRFVGKWLWRKYTEFLLQVEKGNMDQLLEIHSVLCAVKAMCSLDGSHWIEQCRLACGGHGYLDSANLSLIYGVVSAAITYEGDSTVLFLQTARFLLKAWTKHLEGTEDFSETINFCENANEWQNTPKGIIDGFHLVTVGKIKKSYESIQKHMGNGHCLQTAWNMTSVQLLDTSESYSRKIVCEVFWTEVARMISNCTSASLAQALTHVAELYLTFWALEEKGDLLLYTKITGTDISVLQQRYEQLLSFIRPNAVGLVDGFDIRDEILNSTLGAYDGRVYERLMEEALKNPQNAEPVKPSFHKYLRPLMMQAKI